MDDFTDEELRRWLKFSNKPDPKYFKPYVLYRGLFYSDNMCNYVMKICNQLKAPDEVAYKTIEMFDKFLLFYFKDSSFVNSMSNFSWPCIPMKRKIMLFLIAVLQVVTKLIYRHKILKTSDAEKIMIKLGYPFFKSEIINAELCVIDILQDSLMYRTLQECVEFLAVCLRSKADGLSFVLKNEVIFYVYCRYNYLRVELGKSQLLFKSSTETTILLGSAVLFACLILSNRSNEINAIRSAFRSLRIMNAQDVLKATFIILTSI
ncbi:hypothetical protein MN116_001013 [Schistosoma mekongi]|uniref:Cyclin N-terminal domain-containing protein n=1 Tax=Schistosoma mekongi TaxID=38744 RepID=A0AAE2D984_SCHME|nr:hypothetical protein MN116_001013 [Schistosoma mekongi]